MILPSSKCARVCHWRGVGVVVCSGIAGLGCLSLLAFLLLLPVGCSQDQDPYPGIVDGGTTVGDAAGSVNDAGGTFEDAGPLVDAPPEDAGSVCDGDAMIADDGGSGCPGNDGGLDGGPDGGPDSGLGADAAAALDSL